MSESSGVFFERIKQFASRDPYPLMLGIEYVDGDQGRAVVQLRVRENHLNFNGSCHGGAIFTLADTAFGLASNSHGVVAAGIDAHITYHVGARLGDLLTATATEVSRSRKLGVYRIDVSAAERGLIASFTGTVYVADRPNDGAVAVKSA